MKKLQFLSCAMLAIALLCYKKYDGTANNNVLAKTSHELNPAVADTSKTDVEKIAGSKVVLYGQQVCKAVLYYIRKSR
jgi:hypothetical protein